MTHGSVYAGLGGCDLACDRVGIKTLWQIEVDPFCQKVLGHHWPAVQRYGEIRDVKEAELRKVWLITSGFPCPDFSVAGRRAGITGEQGRLFFELARVVAAVRPAWVLLENVPGLLSSGGRRDFATVLNALDDLGYGLAWRVLDSKYFGVAQRRRRVFVVGHLGGPCPPEVLFESQGSTGDTEKGGEKGEAVAASLGGGALGAGRTSEVIGEQIVMDTAYPCVTTSLAARDWRSVKDGDALVLAHILTAPDTNAPKRGGKRRDGSRRDRIPIVVASPLRTNWRNNSNPTSETRMHVMEGMGVRRLTPLECERLQGFPDGWTALGSDSARYRTLGDAVTVTVVEWILRRLVAVAGGIRAAATDAPKLGER